MWTKLLFAPGVVALLLLSACGAPADDASASSESGESASALTTDAVPPPIADFLSGGHFACSEHLSDYRHRGDVVLHVGPAWRSGGSWRTTATLSGTYFTHAYEETDGPITLRLTSAGEVVGTRALNHGDIGHGYYCGGGTAAYHCGPDRTDAVRIYARNGVLRCEVDTTQDEPWQNQAAYAIRSAATRVGNACFDEQWYLAQNPDVASAVAAGAFLTGRHHYALHGEYEGRRACPN